MGNAGPFKEDSGVVEDRVASASSAIQDWLGEGWEKFESPTSDLALRSADGTRVLRLQDA